MSFYGTATAFKTYHTDRGRTIPTSWTDAIIEAALLVASEWIDNSYSNLFSGFKTDGFTQVREWPREAAVTNTYPQYVFDTDEIPDRVVYATYEAAFREATEIGALNVDFTAGQYNAVTVEGAIRVEYKNTSQISDVQLQINIVGSLLAPLIDPEAIGGYSKISGSSVRA